MTFSPKPFTGQPMAKLMEHLHEGHRDAEVEPVVRAEELMKIRSDIPVILCTGYSSAVSKKDALRAGIKAYLEKPIAIQVLADTLQKAIAK